MANDEMFTFYKNALQGTLTKPLCDEYRNEWRSCGDDKERLVRLVMRQQSIPYFMAHCHDGKGLGKEYLMRTFRNYINGKMEISDADGGDGRGRHLDAEGEEHLRAGGDPELERGDRQRQAACASATR